MDTQLSRVVAVINGKGGVGKTSIVANVAGQLAAADYKVLTVDLDISGNLKLDLGYTTDVSNDEGKGLVDAIWNGGTLAPIQDVRPNLDAVPGGKHLEMLTAIAATPMASELPGGGVPQAFAAALAEIAGDYDVVLIDGAPGSPVLQDMTLAAARYVLVPLKTDQASWDGLLMIGPRVKKARQTNPLITYLGAVLFSHQTTATRLYAGTREKLAEVGDTIPLFETFIRHSATAAYDTRNRGQLAHELARDADERQKTRLTLLRSKKRAPGADLPEQLSGTANSLAGDYAQLTREVLTRILAHEQTTPIAAAR